MEVVNLCKIGSEQSTPFHVTSRQPIGDLKDWKEKLQRVEGFVDCRGIVPISLVSKSPYYTVLSRHRSNGVLKRGSDSLKNYCYAWEDLRKAYLPVAPTLRVVSETEVMMTDFCRGGAVLYDKFAAESQRNHTRQSTPTDSIFLQLDISEIESEARSILARAREANITLPLDDALNLVVYPQRERKWSWDLITLDIGSTLFGRSAWTNNDCLHYFMEHIQFLRNSIIPEAVSLKSFPLILTT
jgi:hypothetical protein